MRWPRRALWLAAGGLAAWLWGRGEYVHWRASQQGLGDLGSSEGLRQAVVVPGFSNRGQRANYVNRYRVRAGLRSLDPRAASSVLVLCGGAVAGGVPEAELMVRYARQLGHQGAIRLDPVSRSTWQNIEQAIVLIQDCEAIAIVSNSLHAAKARDYLWQQRPDLAVRLIRGQDHRWGEVVPLKILLGHSRLQGIAERAMAARRR